MCGEELYRQKKRQWIEGDAQTPQQDLHHGVGNPTSSESRTLSLGDEPAANGSCQMERRQVQHPKRPFGSGRETTWGTAHQEKLETSRNRGQDTSTTRREAERWWLQARADSLQGNHRKSNSNRRFTELESGHTSAETEPAIVIFFL